MNDMPTGNTVSFSSFLCLDYLLITSVNPVHNAPPPQLITSDRKQPLLQKGCWESHPKLLAKRQTKKKKKKKKQKCSLKFFQKKKSKKKR